MNRFLIILIAGSLLSLTLFAFVNARDCGVSSAEQPLPWTPEKGFVPDERTAIKIAEAIWMPIYGKSIYDKRPFCGQLMGDSVWVVVGTLPKGMKGGVPLAWINKKDGRIIGVSHGK